MKLAPAFFALAVTGAFAQPQPPEQPQAPRQPPPAPMSARQEDRVAQQGRLIACNRQAREAGLRSGQRQDFIRDCLKGGNAAVGGGGGK